MDGVTPEKFAMRPRKKTQTEIPVYVDSNLPHPLLDKEGNRVLCIEVENPVDGSLSILVHPDDYVAFIIEMNTRPASPSIGDAKVPVA